MATKKKFRLRADQIKRVIPAMGSCFATDMITVHGRKVGFMYREEPDKDIDSGWRFMAGDEPQEYMDNPGSLEIYDVNTIANYDPDIIPCLTAPVGSAFERDPKRDNFVPVDFEPSE